MGTPTHRGEHQMSGVGLKTVPLTVDSAGSVLRRASGPHTYSAFGFLPGACAETAYTGQWRERGLYLLGYGYRAYLPLVGRFASSDVHSPFGRGGLNAYAYCGAEPINRRDASGANWTRLPGKFLLKLKSTRQVYSAVELKYDSGRRVLRFATHQVEDATQMYKLLGTQLSATQDSFGVMVRNAQRVKAAQKRFESIPGYAPLRDPGLFERAIEKHHRTLWASEAIKPVGLDDLKPLPIGRLDVNDAGVRHTVLSYLYYQELADPRVVARRGRIDPWSQPRNKV